jgi:hypothetical protein
MKKSAVLFIYILIGLNCLSMINTQSISNQIDQGKWKLSLNEIPAPGFECWVSVYQDPGVRILFCNKPKTCCYYNDHNGDVFKDNCRFYVEGEGGDLIRLVEGGIPECEDGGGPDM